MNILIIFVIVLFSYIHIYNEYKTSEDLEIYEMDYRNNENLQETCNIKQPVIFERTKMIELPDLLKYKQILTVKDVNDYDKSGTDYNGVQLPCNSLIQLIKSDKDSRYFSENNQTFIEESGLYKQIHQLDGELKPKYAIHTKYDILLGSQNTCTPFRYHTNTRKYIYIAKGGNMRIKMASWKYTKYLHEIKDYENLEFRSPVNIWDTQSKYSDDIDKIEFIEFDLNSGNVIYIPPYWWYSIKYLEEDTIIFEYNYFSIMNKIAFLGDSCKYYLQQQNIIENFKSTKKNESDVNKTEIIEEIVTEKADDEDIKE
jgi:hypothetical protein